MHWNENKTISRHENRKEYEKMIEFEHIKSNLLAYNIALSKKEYEKIDKYADLLVEWNGKINLTAIVNSEDIENKHFIDSLLLAVQPEIKGKLVDVGSGAGFPGMVVKIYRPEVDVTLMEPTGKRVHFLEAVSEELDIPVEVVKERAEEAARKSWRESFDVATARAVAALPILCEYCLPLVKKDGWFIAMKGSSPLAEVEDAKGAIEKLGGKYIETREFTLPDGSSRSLIFIKKEKETPSVYPRNGGTISKKPLK